MKKKLLLTISTILIFFSTAQEAQAQNLCEIKLSSNVADPLLLPVAKNSVFRFEYDSDVIAEHLYNTLPRGGILKFDFPDDYPPGGPPDFFFCRDKNIEKIDDRFKTLDDFKRLLSNKVFYSFQEGNNWSLCDNALLSTSQSGVPGTRTGRHRIRLVYELGGEKNHICQYGLNTKERPPSCSVSILISGVEKDWGTIAEDYKVRIINIEAPFDYHQVKIKLSPDKEFIEPSSKLPEIEIPSNLLLGTPLPSSYTVPVYLNDKDIGGWSIPCGSDSFTVIGLLDPTPTTPPTPTPLPPEPGHCRTLADPCAPENPECHPYYNCPTPAGPPGINAKDICEQIEAGCDGIGKSCADLPPGSDEQKTCEKREENCRNDVDKCNDCFDQRGAWTALGCIKTDVGPFVRDLFRIILGVVGGIAFLLLLKGGYQIMMSRGNAEELAEGQQAITAAIAGLIFIFLAIFILKIIGVDILGLPGFK